MGEKQEEGELSEVGPHGKKHGFANEAFLPERHKGPLLSWPAPLRSQGLKDGYLTTRWDEWVPEDRLVRLDPEGIAFAKELRSEHAKSDMNPRKRRQSVDNLASELSGVDESEIIEPNLILHKSPKLVHGVKSIHINLGNWARRILYNDWDIISKKQCLHCIPAQITAKMAIDKFLRTHPSDLYFSTAQRLITRQVIQFCDGLVHYFNIMIGRTLLYRFERPQFLDVLQDSLKSPADVYGPEYLVRLLRNFFAVVT
ncbi:hypothetical protein PSACC_01561 [Paramicrosporidium saccamoebae]|uniref:MRG domain-containing protein n=1 Tax=Paramicrosporidium saccamoebae TaxID=1246581 RepID=A0A2H9TLU2_9FUNG|nr:hypothetical protein PSACC_01561 [Paramicrosporidium saccamoebae]